MKNDIKLFESGQTSKLSSDPLDEVKVGLWYWVKFEDTEWNKKKGKEVKCGEHEELMC